MKHLLSILILVLSINSSYSQWNTVNIGTAQDLYSVDYYSSNDTWIGSFNQIIKTANGGTSWSIVGNPIQDNLNITIMPANIYDLVLTGSNSAIATGLFYIGNSEHILTTTNGGVNWNKATSDNTVPLLRYLKSVDLFSSRAVAVGNSGRIARSTDAGNSWSFVTSGTSKMISDVTFSTLDTVFAVGDNVILRSVDGGVTWTAKTVAGTIFESVSCDRGVVYIGSSSSSVITKSIDYGNTYSTITLPFSYSGILYALNKDTLLVAGTNGLYVSKNGGQGWEKYILPNYRPVKMIDFLNAATGIAVGDAGYVIKTGNISSAPSLPISMFTIKANSTCLGDSVSFINSTAALNGYSYKWKINDSLFSTQYNSGIRLTSAGTKTISLIVTNSFGSDTTIKNLTVTGHDINPISLLSDSPDSICTGNSIGFSVPNSQPGISYILRKGFTNIGGPQNGNGGTLFFSYLPGISASTAFNIKVVKTTSCFTDSINVVKTISVYPPGTIPNACVPANNYCSVTAGITNVTLNKINNTTSTLVNNYFDYSCCKQTDLVLGHTYPLSVTTKYANGEYVKVWIDYNGDGSFKLAFSGFANPKVTGSITIPPIQVFNKWVRMRVVSDYDANILSSACSGNNCGQTEDYAVRILPDTILPTSKFTLTAATVCGTTVTFTNTAYNATSYLWDFGDSTQSNLLVPPAHNYAVSGNYKIKLIAFNPKGADTSVQILHVANPLVPVAAICEPTKKLASCNYSTIDYFQLNGMNAFAGTQFKVDMTCTEQVNLYRDSTYILAYGLSGGYSNAWIDYNNNGDLDYYTERLATSYLGGSNIQLQFKVPKTATLNKPLRARIVGGDQFTGTSCSSICGTFRDFTVFILPAPLITDLRNEKANENLISIFPNPFGKQTTIKLSLTTKADVHMIIYNSIGQQVAIIENSFLENGDHTYIIHIIERGFYLLKTTIDGVSNIYKLIEME